jgi:DNA end-binding protein Ku
MTNPHSSPQFSLHPHTWRRPRAASAFRTIRRCELWYCILILADEELREVAPERSTGIEIQEFVNEAEISSLYFEKPYYLEPDKGAGKAFALLREALIKTGKVGIAQFVLRNRDSLCMLKPHGQGLVLNALRFASEIRSMEELSLPSSEKISPSEVSLAMKLIEID